MFDEKNHPKTWPICDIVTGTTKSALGLLHAVFWNKTTLVEKNVCYVLHRRLKSYDNCHGFFEKEFDKIVQRSNHSLPKSTETFNGMDHDRELQYTDHSPPTCRLTLFKLVYIDLSSI